MPPLNLPAEVTNTLTYFRTAEFATISKDGSPTTWPVLCAYRASEGLFVTATSISFPQKVFNIRRNPKVSLLFSEPHASRLTNPAAVLVRGDAEAPDRIVSSEGIEDFWRQVFAFQPPSQRLTANAIGRWLMDWYYMRLPIFIRPRRISWWAGGDFSKGPQVLEVAHVG